MAENEKKIKITLKRGLAGTLQNQRATVQALGLTKTGSSRVHTDNAAIRGMITVVSHLVSVEEI